MENKSNGLLKVAGILMIIGGILGIIVGIIAMIAVGAIALLAGISSGLLTVAAILAIVGSVVELIAGIVGVANAARPEKAQICIVFGILVIAISVISNVVSIVGGGSFNVAGLALGAALPIIYLIGAFQNKSKAA